MDMIQVPAEYYHLLIALVDAVTESEEYFEADLTGFGEVLIFDAHKKVVDWEQGTGAHVPA